MGAATDSTDEQAQIFLSAEGEHFLARWYWALVLVPWALVRSWNVFFLSPNQDLQHYFEAANGLFAGKIPYRDFSCEYPPGALPFFALPRLFSSDFVAYERWFAAEMMLVDLGVLAMLAMLARTLWPVHARDTAKPWRASLCCAQMAYVWLTGSLGYLAFERYDLVFAATILAFVAFSAHSSQRDRLLGALALAASVAIKFVSIVLLPVWLLYLLRCHSSAASNSSRVPRPMWRTFADAWVRPLALFGGALSAMVAPVALLAGQDFNNFLAYHQGRGLQFESTASSLLLMLRDRGWAQVGSRFAYGAAELTGPWVQTLANWAALATLVLVGWVAARTHTRLGEAQDARARTSVLLTATLATLMMQMVANKVFSPQYMLWLTPLAAALFLLRDGRLRPAVVGLFVANAVTSLILFFYYINLLRLERMGVYLLATRNTMVLVTGLHLAGIDLPHGMRPLGRKVLDEGRRFATHPWVALAGVGMTAFWVLLANFSETTANDIWIQLRSGEDIWKSGTVPYTEVYSAVVSGRPFIAHEWLCGVFFYLSTLLLGDAGLCVMTAVVAFGVFWNMYYTFEPKVRAQLWYVPLLIYSNYLVAFRVLARPHIFTIWAQAALIMAIEQWRRKGGLSRLWWLVPVQIVWINLHGAALFGPALMGMVTGLTFLFVLLPNLDGTNPRRYSFVDVKHGAIMTVALMLACFVNPYGTRIVTFSLDLLGNEYAKSRVWEWTTPFLQMNTYYYWLWIWMAETALLWFTLMLRIKERPVFDLSYAVLATYLGVRANRFMPDFALLAFPVLARSMYKAFSAGVRPAFRVRRPWLELGLCSLLIGNCVVYGYAHSVREHRPLPGWGYGGDMPYQEVGLLKKLKVRGTIYNEYSDGSLIINQLWPDIRPVLDSRIDLYPIDLVNDYDTAYVNPEAFAAYIKKRNVNIVMMYRNRAQPGIVQFLETHPQWRRLSDVNNRLLYVTRESLPRAAQSL